MILVLFCHHTNKIPNLHTVVWHIFFCHIQEIPYFPCRSVKMQCHLIKGQWQVSHFQAQTAQEWITFSRLLRSCYHCCGKTIVSSHLQGNCDWGFSQRPALSPGAKWCLGDAEPAAASSPFAAHPSPQTRRKWHISWRWFKFNCDASLRGQPDKR